MGCSIQLDLYLAKTGFYVAFRTTTMLISINGCCNDAYNATYMLRLMFIGYRGG